jgi:hypothetical protein
VEDSPINIGEILKVVVFANDEMIFYRAGGNAYRTHHLFNGGTLSENDLLLIKSINPINGAISSERVTDGKADGCTCILFDPIRVVTT